MRMNRNPNASSTQACDMSSGDHGDPLLSFTSSDDLFADLTSSLASTTSADMDLISPPSPPWSDIMDLTPNDEDIVNAVLDDELESEHGSEGEIGASLSVAPGDDLLPGSLVKLLDVYEGSWPGEQAMATNEAHLSPSPQSISSSSFDEETSMSSSDGREDDEGDDDEADEEAEETATMRREQEVMISLDDMGLLASSSLDAKLLNGNDLKPSQSRSQQVNGSDLRSHQVGHCSVCKLVFTSPQLLASHFSEYVKKRLTCCQCGKKFSSNSRLISHHRKHSREKPFECQSCGKFYTHRTTLVRHQLHYCTTLRAKCEDLSPATALLHGPPRQQQPPQLPLTKPSTLPTNEMITTWGEHRLPDTSKTISLHPTTITTLITQPPAQVVVVDQEEVEVGIRSANDIPPRTSQPDTRDPTPESKCRVCQKEFYDMNSLNQHMTYNLTNRSCCLCHKVLGNKSKLLTHHRSHTKESPYECQLCGKRFSENSTLRKHEATHGAKQFHCSFCDKAFARKDYLLKHVQTHQQTFRCSECSFVCHSKNDITNHVDMHKHTKEMGSFMADIADGCVASEEGELFSFV
eukprot:snap_masked-scaffold810_size94089-processed-gene-0.11 protein:Tk05707 transcript:snap_masked-scaffold810_size94089-processed-gene-0.11-mRNA-1 annotation:"zinc finger protein 674"